MNNAPAAAPLPGLAIVAIGRNEGARLHRCLTSALPHASCLVYVDSGSTDGSAAWAREQGVIVVDLDLSTPFTAARARNAGWRRALACQPGLRWVQFVDGDCELQPTWPSAAMALLEANPRLAVVCGRRRERFPDASVYNQLCDWEWDTPVGLAKACGGDAMFRLDALQAAGGYLDTLIAGEEPELCVRLRAMGWQVWRADAEMTLHDAAMTRFGQWWQRSRRAGYAFAEGARLHGAPPERHWVRETRRAVLWGLALPAVLAGASLLILAMTASCAWASAPWLLLPAQWLRLFARERGAAGIKAVKVTFLLLGKVPESWGVVQSFFSGDTPRQLIEYK